MKKLFKIVQYVFVSVFIVFVYGFSSYRNSHKKITAIHIKIENDSHLFITPETVDKLLIQKLGNPNSHTKDNLFLNDLEATLHTNKLVEKADVYVDINGGLGVIIKQKTPIARVLNANTVFYIDTKGNKMPLSQNYSASVPTVSGVSSDAEISKVYQLAQVIYNDPFLKDQIIGIRINENNEFELFTRFENAVVLLGDLSDLDRKINNFKAYYLNAKQQKLTHNYKKINLKYSNQVVCTK